jgi:hypothetical protein
VGENSIKDVTRSQGYSIGAALAVEATYFIAPKIGLEASIGLIGYSFSRMKYKMEPELGIGRGTTVKTNGGVFRSSHSL